LQKSLEDGRKNSRGVYDGAFEEAEDNLEDTSEDVARHNKKKDGKNRKTISSRECEIGGHRITIGENSDNDNGATVAASIAFRSHAARAALQNATAAASIAKQATDADSISCARRASETTPWSCTAIAAGEYAWSCECT